MRVVLARQKLEALKQMTATRASRAAVIAAVQAEWRAVQLSAEPVRFGQAEAAIRSLYVFLGLPAPHFVRLPSPLAAELYVNLLGLAGEDGGAAGAFPKHAVSDTLMSEANGLFRKQLDWAHFNTCLSGPADDLLVQMETILRCEIDTHLRDRPGKVLRQEVQAQLLGHLGGRRARKALEALSAWPPAPCSGAWRPVRFGRWEMYSAWFDACRRIGGQLPPAAERALDLLADISRSAGWWYPFSSYCIVTDRPCFLGVDGDARLHATGRRAAEYRDGSGAYAWHGLAAPPDWIEGRLPSAAAALHWRNMEQRRMACEMIGWAAILQELDAREIDRHPNPMIGTVVEVSLPDIGLGRFLRVICGTGREFALRVPPGVRTAIEAQSLIQRIPPEMVERIEVRT